jgi:hypothetical protein
MKNHRYNQKGLALPTALLLILVVSSAGALFSSVAIRSFTIQRIENTVAESYQVSEGAIHDIIGEMSSRPHLWRDRVPLNTIPLSYTEYSQLDYAGTNGIPSCSGQNCIRNLYPTGGGIVKNFGPRLGAGATVDASKTVWNQLSSSSLPTADVTLNSQMGFSQVERLDESIPTGTNLGADMSNNPAGGSTPRNIRFRITGKTYNSLGTRTGQSTVVVVAEIPST